MPGNISEETIKSLPVPDTGNRITYFAGAKIQGAKAPRGFGVRVTAGGARALCSTTGSAGANTAIRLAGGRTGPRLRPFAQRGTYAAALTVARTPLTIEHRPLSPKPSQSSR